MSKSFILVTGGAGFIGSMVNLTLQDLGYNTIIIDNLSTGDKRTVIKGTLHEGDLSDLIFLKEIFKKYSIDAVMHFAASTDVGESFSNPEKYYKNNVVNTLNLLSAMQEAQVSNLIFSSSAAVYGIPKTMHVKEDSCCEPINPYGETKWMVEKILRDYALAYKLKFCALRYFNAAGGDPSGKLKHFKKKENNLIPLVLDSIINQKKVIINGNDYPTPDGTCVRDFIHVADLASAHVLAMQKLLNGKTANCYNLGNGRGFSVNDVIRVAEKVTGQSLLIEKGPRRPGDPPILLADATKAEIELGWIPKHPELETIIEHAWKARQP